MAMGTPDYVAPRCSVTGMVADHRADLYAVGVMLYQMLTGEVPRGMFKLPSQKGIGTDLRFDDIICKAMEPRTAKTATRARWMCAMRSTSS
jgi:serine/threonine protein kinase